MQQRLGPRSAHRHTTEDVPHRKLQQEQGLTGGASALEGVRPQMRLPREAAGETSHDRDASLPGGELALE